MEELRREYVSLMSTRYSLTLEESHLTDKIEALRQKSVDLQLHSEIEEEHATNQLFRRLDGAEKDVHRYESMLQEEEREVDRLSREFTTVCNAKSEIENKLEERQEYRLINLHRKLLDLVRTKTDLEQQLMAEGQRYLDVLLTEVHTLRGLEHSGSDSLSSAAPSAAVEPPPVLRLRESHVDASTTLPPSALLSVIREEPQLAAAALSVGPEAATSQRPCAVRRGPASGGSSALVSAMTTPRSNEAPSRTSFSSESHQAVVDLELHLNRLLKEHADAMKRSGAMQQQCADLAAKLRSVQEATFLDRARASKLKEELDEATRRMTELKSSSFAARDICGEDSSCLNSSRVLEPSTSSLAMGSMSLRERTKELLSSVPPSGL